MARTAQVTRNTKETSIDVSINLDGSGTASISTGIPFYDHMLSQVGKHGGFDLRIAAKGDIHIDTHHTVEDVAITFGEAIRYTEGLGFFHWSGNYWKPDVEGLEMQELAKHLAPVIASEVVNYEGDTEKQSEISTAQSRGLLRTRIVSGSTVD